MKDFRSREEKSGLWDSLAHTAFRSEIFVGLFLLALTAFGIASL